jgi:diguanylate cyclase (GGDEF)-like protein
MKTHKSLIVFLSIFFLLLIGYTDYLTGAELSFSIFYLLPILSTTWFLNKTWGILLSVTGASIWIISDIYTHTGYVHFLIPYWNGFVRLSFFLIFTLLVSRVKIGWDMEKRIARTDPLTGVNNSRSFIELADLELERVNRHKNSFSIAYIDLDNFKAVNDTRGHVTGDRLLRLVAEIMLSNSRRIDITARMGGDEFIILLPDADEHSAIGVLERIREKLLDAMKANGWPVTFSIGVMTFHRPPDSVTEMIREADGVMYEVKNAGKDQIKMKTF